MIEILEEITLRYTCYATFVFGFMVETELSNMKCNLLSNSRTMTMWFE